MSSISTAIALTDRITAPLQNICAAINMTISGFESMQYASGTAFDTSAFEGAHQLLAETEVQLSEIANSTQQATRKQDEYNQKVNAGTNAADSLLRKVTAFVGAYAGISTVQNVLGLSDELTQTTARLDMMVNQYNELNGTMQTTEQLSQMIYQSAQNSRASYLNTAASVAKLGNNARDAFSSTEEIVNFAELVNKEFVIAGASATESSNAFLQLTQALGSGALRGDELNSIFEQAPNLIQTIADYMDVPIGQIKEMASEGEITADIVKNAMFAATDEINAKFEEMPMTWGQLGTSFQNQALMIFQPVLQRLNDMANSSQMQTSITGVMNALSGVATVALTVVDIMATGGAFIVDNWSVIAPIIGGVATALGIYTIALGAYNAAQAISNGLKAAAALRDSVHAAALAMQTGMTFTATAAQYGFNAALLACPLTWILLIIIAVIAAIYAVVAAINKATGSTYSATGIIMGVLNSLLQYVKNMIAYWWNIIAAFVNFFANVFNDPVASIKILFWDLCNTVIGFVLKMAEAIESVINNIPGMSVDLTSGLSNIQDSITAAAEQVKSESEWVEVVGTMDYGSYEDAYNSGYEWGQGVEDKVSDFFGGVGGLGDVGSYGAASDMASNISNIAGDTSNISDSLDVSEEDLKYLRDIAEQEAINRFTTAEINLDMSGMQNSVTNTNDLDGIVDGMTTKLLEAMEIVKEGV